MPEYQMISVEPKPNATVVQILTPRLSDWNTVSDFQDELLQMIGDTRPVRLVISFRGVVQCSTAVINALLRAKKRLISEEGSLRLCGMSDDIRDAYRYLNLDGTVFDIDKTLEDSLKAIEPEAG